MESNTTQPHFLLRSDTVGHFQNPRPENIEQAFRPQGGKPNYHDIIKLLRTDGEYLAAKFFTAEGFCRIAHKHNDMLLDTVELLSIDEAVEIFKRYLLNDIDWTHDYHWEKSFGQRVKEMFG